MSQEPDAVLNLRTITTTIDDATGTLVLTDGDTTVHLVPCGGGPDVAEGLSGLIHEAGYLWEIQTRRLRHDLYRGKAGEQG